MLFIGALGHAAKGLYRLKGMMNVVRCLHDSARGTCQNPLLASSFENTLAPAKNARVSSTCGIGYASRSTFSFKGYRSMHIHMPPDFFWTTTMCEHHVVGWSMLLMTPEASICLSSFCTLSCKGMGIFRAVKSE